MSDDKKVAWNASQGLIMEISNRRVSANTFFINGNMRKALNTLIAIKQSVIQSFNLEERKELIDIEEKFNKLSTFLNSNMRSSFNSSVRNSFIQANTMASKIYSEYNEKLMDLLEKYGYLISEQADASKMRF